MSSINDWRMGALMWTGSLLCTACVGELSLLAGPSQNQDAGVSPGLDAANGAPRDAAQSAPGDAGDDDPDPGPVDDVDGGGPPVDTGPGLPCEVAEVFSRCTGCHGDPPTAAPIPLVTYEHLVAPSRVAGLRVVDVALRRMQDTARPMPPAPAAPVDDVSPVEAWIAAGTPREECNPDPDPGPDPDPTDPFAGPVTCTSDTFWTRGNTGSPLMHPGAACIDCHTRMGDGPRLTIAGTVFPTGHEPTDCNGLTSTAEDPVLVEITDANGNVVTLQANGVGNFRATSAIAAPFTAVVRYQGRVRAMMTPQRNGDCNSCHTVDGANGAPGRIVAP